MKSSFSIILLTTLTLTLTACKSTGLKIGNVDIGGLVNQGVAVWDASTVDEAEEQQFGQNMSAILLGTRGLHQSESLNHYVNKVGMWLALNSAKPDLPWKFGVIDSSAINAFAAPGGYVFVTSGMLLQLENEAQLAAILAHEIIHVVEQHHLIALQSNTYSQAATETLFISAQAYQGNVEASAKDKEYTQWLKKISGAAQDLYSKGLEREDEFQADKYGIRLLAKSGYDPFAFIDNLQLLQGISPDDSSLALMYKTHPTPSQRLQAISSQIEALSAFDGELLVHRFNENLERMIEH